MFNAEDFCLQYSIDFKTDSRDRWVNITCPFCDDHGYHLGINVYHEYTTCFKCGWHWLPKTISTILNVGLKKAQRVIREHSSATDDKQQTVIQADELILPSEFKPLSELHYNYLRSREFGPSTARTWRLLATGIHGSYSHRIIAPIYLDGVLVSYQGRDITERSPLRYKACEGQHEVCPHQHTLYGIDEAKSNSVIIVEGITDVWRVGPGAVSCFGIEWSTQQARMIASRFKRFHILFDNEEQAGEKAYSLYQYLTSQGLDGEIVTLPESVNDPAELTYAQVLYVRKELGI
jgi:DNA primase